MGAEEWETMRAIDFIHIGIIYFVVENLIEFV